MGPIPPQHSSPSIGGGGVVSIDTRCGTILFYKCPRNQAHAPSSFMISRHSHFLANFTCLFTSPGFLPLFSVRSSISHSPLHQMAQFPVANIVLATLLLGFVVMLNRKASGQQQYAEFGPDLIAVDGFGDYAGGDPFESLPKRAPLDRSAMARFGKRAPLDRSAIARFGKRAPLDRSAMARFGKRAPLDRSAIARFGK